MQAFDAIGEQFGVRPDQQVLLTSPDARGLGTRIDPLGIVGYTVWCAAEIG